jgi:hypothetical protein
VVFTAVDKGGFCMWDEVDHYGKNNRLYYMRPTDTMYAKHVAGINGALGVAGRSRTSPSRDA